MAPSNKKAKKDKWSEEQTENNLWKSLKNGETGLGWDASANRLDCSDEWWDTLALGISNRDVGERFQHSRETISRAFHDVLEAITAKVP
ncbi:myb/SANT-like domain-containing protein [Artemisia annua]|uniref:Myb/SANT-like domain-containing protein n=1 Tax=Artemisia annua TaxID=35608 RepID=A0A2U1MIV7_ARTAN|nr:myb/SANT-like domain-containing protein [Artemisia annua]